MPDVLSFNPSRALDANANGSAGAKAYFYDSGTTTLRTVYSDAACTVPHPSPLVADANGTFAAVFSNASSIKVVVTDSAGATLYTIDPCVRVAASGAAASAISFSPTVALPYDNVQAAIEGSVAAAASGYNAFGLGVTGSVALLANLDATNTASGQYRFDGTTTGTYPTGVLAADTGAVLIVRETSGSAWMVLYHDTTDRRYYRRMNTSTWGTWREDLTANQGFAAGDTLYHNGTNLVRLAKGTALQSLRMNAGATAPEWATVSLDSMTLLGTLTTTSGTTQTLSGLTLTGYKKLLCVANGVSHDNGAGRSITLAGGAISDLFISSAAAYGDIWIDLTTSRFFGAWSSGAVFPSSVNHNSTGLTTSSTSISFALSGTGNFDAGSILVYGVK